MAGNERPQLMGDGPVRRLRVRHSCVPTVAGLLLRQLARAARSKALASRARHLLSCARASGELSLGELARSRALAQAIVSPYPPLLRRDGLIGRRREAQGIHDRSSDRRVPPLTASLSDCFAPTAERRFAGDCR